MCIWLCVRTKTLLSPIHPLKAILQPPCTKSGWRKGYDDVCDCVHVREGMVTMMCVTHLLVTWLELHNLFYFYEYNCNWSNKKYCRFFSYSLDNRIIPRHKVLVENRINFKLRYMLAGSDNEFHQRVVAAIERRQRFESGIMDINSQTQTTSSSSEKIQVNSSQMQNPQDSVPLPSWSSMCKCAPFFFTVY